LPNAEEIAVDQILVLFSIS